MVGHIPDEIIMQVRERTDIVALVGEYVQLKPAGSNHVGLCPFHSEKTPSFNVNGSRQFFHCFGCGAGGNAISFLMQIEGLAFPQAVRRLAERAGVEIPQEQASEHERQRRREREQLYAIYERATEFYHRLLLDDPRAAKARGYIRRRGFSSEAVRRFRLGYAPESWDALSSHLHQHGIDLEQARQLGLLRAGSEGRNDYDMFRNRLLFPIENVFGRVVAFGGRVLDDSLPKYINSPESMLYHKSQTLYGLYQAKNEMRRQRKVVVVEGYFDHLALVQAGILPVVASCGTALTTEHAQSLKRYVDQVILLFDQDAAGQKACFRALPMVLDAGLQVATLTLPAGDDPDSCIRREGAEAFSARLDGARSALEYFMEVQLAQAGDAAEEQARAVSRVLQMLRHVGDEIERNLHLATLARLCGLGRELLERQLATTVVAPVEATPLPTSAAVPATPVAARPQPPQRQRTVAAADMKAQRWLLTLMVNDEALSRQVVAAGIENLLNDSDCRQLAQRVNEAWQQGQTPGDWLLNRCEQPELQALLTRILISGQEMVDENIEQIFGDCRLAVVQGQLKRRRTELHALMREAEHQGDSSRHTACLQELTQINRQLKSRNL